MKTLLITAASVIKYTPIRGGVDHDVVNPKIETAQDLALAYVIGYPLLKKLQTVVGGGADPDGKYAALLSEYVAPYLRWETALQLIPDIAYSLGSGGANTPTSNQGSTIFDGTMAIVTQNIRSSATGYKTLLINHLCNSGSTYPEYYKHEQGKQQKTDGGTPFHGIQIN